MVIKKVVLASVMMSALLFHSGCSFLFVKGPPAKHADMESFECSQSNGWPVVDVIWAGLNGLGAASAARGSQDMQSAEAPDPNTVIAVGLSWLVVSGISSIYGFYRVSECKKAKRMRVRPPAPNEEGEPPAGPGNAPAAGVAPTRTPPAPTSTPAPAPAPPAAAPTPAPAPPAVAPAPAAPSLPPTTSLRLRSPTHVVRSSPPRALAMRPAH